jgi:arginine/lysine/ornithine decarboxylase
MHGAAPLYDSVREFVARGQAPFYSPGHKGGRSLDPWFREHIADLDLNNLPDTDTQLQQPGFLRQRNGLARSGHEGVDR